MMRIFIIQVHDPVIHLEVDEEQWEVLYLQPLIPPKRFDIFSPMAGGCSEGLGAF